MNILKLSSQQVIALKRKRGERNLTIDELANEVGISRFTVSRILHNDSQNLTSTTVKKVNDWIIDQYTTIN
nr:helix-turn-helix transcriptional regulator [Lactobacillus crispatus]